MATEHTEHGTDIDTDLKQVQLEKRLAELKGFAKQVNTEIVGTAGIEFEELSKEKRRIEGALERVQRELFELRQLVTREVGVRECKCPTCERWIPAGTPLTEQVIRALKAR